jgi:hypothetical protein
MEYPGSHSCYQLKTTRPLEWLSHLGMFILRRTLRLCTFEACSCLQKLVGRSRRSAESVI